MAERPEGGLAPALLFRWTVKNYDIQVEREMLWNQTGEEIEGLYNRGVVRRDTACRVSGTDQWRDVNELFPILKYQHPTALAGGSEAPSVQSRPQPIVDVEHDDSGRPGLTSALKAGWICFGIGAAVAWIFPPAFLFYSVALILSIVALCTRQVNRGLTLLPSSFVGMGTSALLSLFLAVGLFAAAVGPAVEKANRRMEENRANEKRAINDFNAAQAKAFRTIEQAIASPPPAPPPFAPLVRQSPPQSRQMPRSDSLQSMSQRELFLEIGRLEKQQRELRKAGRDLPPDSRDYLVRLQATHDRASAN